MNVRACAFRLRGSDRLYSTKFYRANSAFLFDWVCLYIIVWCILYTTISKLRFCPKKCTFFPRVGSFWTFRMIAKSKEMW